MLGLDDLRRAVEGLHPRLAEPYRLYAFDGMDYAEIAARLRIPVPTVGTRLLRARRKLRDALSRPEGACTPLVAKRRRLPPTTIGAFAA
jgi:RNA polymerase sigma-70 factor (ECF subfamily)